MKYETPLKFLAVVLGFALWAYLGLLGKTNLDSMIDLLKLGLGALVYHMTSPQPLPPEPVPAPTAAPTRPMLYVPGKPDGEPVRGTT